MLPRATPIRYLDLFGIVTGTASLLGLAVSLWQVFQQPTFQNGSYLPFFTMLLVPPALWMCIRFDLMKSRFMNFVLRHTYLELGSRGRVHLTCFTAVCPLCDSRMRLRTVGPPRGTQFDRFICERNSRHHVFELDPTALSDVDD